MHMNTCRPPSPPTPESPGPPVPFGAGARRESMPRSSPVDREPIIPCALPVLRAKPSCYPAVRRPVLHPPRAAGEAPTTEAG